MPTLSAAIPALASALVAAVPPSPAPVPGATPMDGALAAAPAGLMERGSEILYGSIGVFLVAFLVTLLATPIMRKLAVAYGVVDKPLEARKQHRIPVAYLGGVAVTVGLLAGITYSYLAPLMRSSIPFELMAIPNETDHEQRPVPFSVLLGLMLIMLTGLIDDVAKLDPRLKIAGQLLAAAALALDDVGVRVAVGFLQPIGQLVGNESLTYFIHMPFEVPFLVGNRIEIDIIYWTGTAIIAIFVLGACNASNLIDGLDGLLSGVTAIAAAGLMVIALGLAALHDGPLDQTRVVLALALMGACLGFLPHNFNPATIFLGDCGSLTLGYMTIVIVLMLGDTGKTHLVIAGLIIYSIPIIDTVLAILRRKLAGKPMSVADDQHLHHQLKRAFGVKGAVFTLYGIGFVFAALGVWLSTGRVRVVFTIAIVTASFIAVTAVKAARRQAIEAHMEKTHGTKPAPTPTPPSATPTPEPALPKRQPEPAR
jgi:UDP-GlcNAc:undecaprenyl-phosphate/decaprenyl-phosphate GlcNAc-1-phosphate transferase